MDVQTNYMPYRPPLVTHETFVADPIELPVRKAGDPGPSGLARAEVLSAESWGVTLKAVTADGQTLAAEGNVLRVTAGPITAEITLDPWNVRFLDADGRLLVGQNPGEEDISGRM